MNVIAVDDEELVLELTGQLIKEVLPNCSLTCFTSYSKALTHAALNRIDLAFLDIKIGGMSGMELAKRLKDTNGKINIVFVTGYSEYALESDSIDSSEFLLKPLTKDMVVDAINRLA